MGNLNFSIHAPQPRPKRFDPRANISLNATSILWTCFAAMAVAGATFVIVWFG